MYRENGDRSIGFTDFYVPRVSIVLIWESWQERKGVVAGAVFLAGTGLARADTRIPRFARNDKVEARNYKVGLRITRWRSELQTEGGGITE